MEDGKWQEERESIEKNIQLVCRWGVCSYMDDVGCLGFDQVLSNVSVDAKTVIIMKNTGMVKVGCAANYSVHIFMGTLYVTSMPREM
ncbi:hypothetical protein N1I87_01100 [Bacillus sp. FSL W8-0102]|uniref:hypothetical protein n=1 Tax=Bacillus sp. FSL W8-0102 TaxID=2978205 RepID=UPI0030FC19A5